MKKAIKLTFFIFVLFVFLYIFGAKEIFQSYSETKKDYQYLSLFSEVASLINTNYFEEVKPENKFHGAYSAMLSSLDKFSSYLNIEKTEIFRLYQNNSSYSTGIYGIKLFDYFYITDILKDSSAEKAGLKPGDIIKTVNEHSIYSCSFWKMYLSLLSNKSERIKLTVLKKSTKKEDKINIMTEPINTNTKIRKIGKDILLVELSRIDESSVNILKNNLKKNKPLKIIMDLRRYSGGDFESLKKITRLFFNKTISLTIKTKNKQEKLYLGSKNTLQYKTVVIINKSTIMYSELLAALFKTYKDKTRCSITIIGDKTRGFVSKLKHIILEDGSSVLITEGLFLLNNKNNLLSGVKPHIELSATGFDQIITKSISILNTN